MPCATAGAGTLKLAPAAIEPAPVRRSRRLMAALRKCTMTRRGPEHRFQRGISNIRPGTSISGNDV